MHETKNDAAQRMLTKVGGGQPTQVLLRIDHWKIQRMTNYFVCGLVGTSGFILPISYFSSEDAMTRKSGQKAIEPSGQFTKFLARHLPPSRHGPGP